MLTDLACDLHAVHLRHDHVNERHIKQLLIDQAERLGAAVHRGDLCVGPAFLQLQLGHHQVDVVVVHHQDAQGLIAQLVIDQVHERVCALRRLHGNLKPEQCASALLAVHPDLAAMQRHQFFAQRQTQARAPIGPVGLHIGMFKTPKNVGLPLTGNAPSGILHLKTHVLAAGHHAHRHRALVCEFDAVVHQVVQDLQQTVGVAMHPVGQVGAALKTQDQALVLGFCVVAVLQIVLQGLQGKVHAVQAQLAGLQL